MLRWWKRREEPWRPAPQENRLPPSILQRDPGPEPEVDFHSASASDIVDLYRRNGCVLLRNFVDPDNLRTLMSSVDLLYDAEQVPHFRPEAFAARGLPAPHDMVFSPRHNDLLYEVFGGPYEVHPDTTTRQVVPDHADADGAWMAPLGPHLDVFFHSFDFTVNFWVPFRNCGVDAPSLGVVRATFEEMVNYSGYDGGETGEGQRPGEWNLPRFAPGMTTLAFVNLPGYILLRPSFHNRVWTPSYNFGDAMMLSNWTLHFSHATPVMTQRRGSVELRFRAWVSIQDITDRWQNKKTTVPQQPKRLTGTA